MKVYTLPKYEFDSDQYWIPRHRFWDSDLCVCFCFSNFCYVLLLLLGFEYIWTFYWRFRQLLITLLVEKKVENFFFKLKKKVRGFCYPLYSIGRGFRYGDIVGRGFCLPGIVSVGAFVTNRNKREWKKPKYRACTVGVICVSQGVMTLQLHTRSTPFRENQDFKDIKSTSRISLLFQLARG
jgi:hypothetical protein